MGKTPSQRMAEGMSRRFKAPASRDGEVGSDRFDLSEDEGQALQAVWLGSTRDLLANLFSIQMTEFASELRNGDVTQVLQVRAQLDALENFWRRIERTVEAAGEAQ